MQHNATNSKQNTVYNSTSNCDEIFAVLSMFCQYVSLLPNFLTSKMTLTHYDITSGHVNDMVYE